jgi:hypothetical protein
MVSVQVRWGLWLNESVPAGPPDASGSAASSRTSAPFRTRACSRCSPVEPRSRVVQEATVPATPIDAIVAVVFSALEAEAG